MTSGEAASGPDGTARMPGSWREAAMALCVGVIMAVVCWGCISLAAGLGPSVPIWPANAVAIALLLSTHARRWPLWMLAAWLGDLAASLVTGEGPRLAVALSACNLVAIVVSAVGIRRLVGPSLDLTRSGHLIRFILIAGLIAPLVSAVFAAVVLGRPGNGDSWLMLGTWAAANSLGAVVVVPLLLTLRDQSHYLRLKPFTIRAALALAVLAGVCVAVFSARQPLVFLVLPALLLVVFELEMVGAAWGLVMVAAIAVTFTLMGRGPASTLHQHAAAMVLVVQLFLAAITLMSLPTAAALAHRRRLQSELAESAERTAELYRRAKLAEEVAGVGYWRLESHTRKLACSETLAASFGLDPQHPITAEDIIGRLHPDDRDILFQTASQTLGDSASLQFRVVRPDGEQRVLLGKAAVERDARGRITARFGTTIDITELKKAEAELSAAREAAEAAAVVKGDFLANMSHELRTPLTSVLGFTRLALEQPDLSDVSRGYISKASNAGSALLSTVNDILDFSKLESGQLQIRIEAADPAAVCAETLELFSETAAAKGLSLRFAPGELPSRLTLDPNRVRQLLLNLVGNAVKFSDGGEVVLSARWRAEDQHLVVSVQDQGPGIAPEQQSLLFRRFSQVDGSSTRRFGGTGLGLAICLGLVEAMGGVIGVDSDLGRGARFYFEIPAPPAEAELDAPQEQALIFPSGARILVADDHPANRELVRAVLAPLGAEVCEACDGAAAVEAASEGEFDLILMDLRMPVLDGLNAMKAIRLGDGPNQGAPILAFSAGADAPGAAARLEAGFDGDLSKPVLPMDLIAAVCAFVNADAFEMRVA